MVQRSFSLTLFVVLLVATAGSDRPQSSANQGPANTQPITATAALDLTLIASSDALGTAAPAIPASVAAAEPPAPAEVVAAPVPQPEPVAEPAAVAPAARVAPVARVVPAAPIAPAAVPPPATCPASHFCYPRVGISGPIVPYGDCSASTDVGTAIRSLTCVSPTYLAAHAYTQFGRITGWRSGDFVFAFGTRYVLVDAFTQRSCDYPARALAPLSLQTSLTSTNCGQVLVVQGRPG